jgi:hypothetical protein
MQKDFSRRPHRVALSGWPESSWHNWVVPEQCLMSRIKKLDGLRAMAILGVLPAHFTPPYRRISGLFVSVGPALFFWRYPAS